MRAQISAAEGNTLVFVPFFCLYTKNSILTLVHINLSWICSMGIEEYSFCCYYCSRDWFSAHEYLMTGCIHMKKVIKVDRCTFHWLFPSVYHLSGFYNDPPKGGSTHRGSGLTCAVIHRSGAVQRHPIGPGASAKLCTYQPLALIRFHDDSVNF